MFELALKVIPVAKEHGIGMLINFEEFIHILTILQLQLSLQHKDSSYQFKFEKPSVTSFSQN